MEEERVYNEMSLHPSIAVTAGLPPSGTVVGPPAGPAAGIQQVTLIELSKHKSRKIIILKSLII